MPCSSAKATSCRGTSKPFTVWKLTNSMGCWGFSSRSTIGARYNRAPCKPNSSTRSPNASKTSKIARSSCGGIFDFDQKKLRLSEVERITEDPDIWNEPQRAQGLGKEKKALEGVVGTLE